MKKVFYLSCVIMTMFLSKCYDPSVERDEEYMTIYIPMCQEKISTLQNIPLVENTVNFVPLHFKTEKDTLLKVGVYCGGMILPMADINLKMGLELDSLISLQEKGVPLSVYKLLPENYYTVDSWDITIPKGQVSENLNIDIKYSEIPSGSKYVLPLKIVNSSDYAINRASSFLLLGINKE